MNEFFSFLAGWLASEFSEVAPWLAGRIARRAALWRPRTPLQERKALAEEWAALVSDRPGKLVKLATASWFMAWSVGGQAVVVAVSAPRWAVGQARLSTSRIKALISQAPRTASRLAIAGTIIGGATAAVPILARESSNIAYVGDGIAALVASMSLAIAALTAIASLRQARMAAQAADLARVQLHRLVITNPSNDHIEKRTIFLDTNVILHWSSLAKRQCLSCGRQYETARDDIGGLRCAVCNPGSR